MGFLSGHDEPPGQAKGCLVKGLSQKADWLETVENIVKWVKMKCLHCQFPEALFFKVMSSKFIEIGLAHVIEASVMWLLIFVEAIVLSTRKCLMATSLTNSPCR